MNYTIPANGLLLPTGHRLYFAHGQIVFLKTDKDQLPRMVLRMSLQSSGSVTYALGQGASESWHCKEEISATKDVLATLI